MGVVTEQVHVGRHSHCQSLHAPRKARSKMAASLHNSFPGAPQSSQTLPVRTPWGCSGNSPQASPDPCWQLLHQHKCLWEALTLCMSIHIGASGSTVPALSVRICILSSKSQSERNTGHFCIARAAKSTRPVLEGPGPEQEAAEPHRWEMTNNELLFNHPHGVHPAQPCRAEAPRAFPGYGPQASESSSGPLDT